MIYLVQGQLSLILSGVSLLGTIGLALLSYNRIEAINNRIDDNSNRIDDIVPDVTSICSAVCFILLTYSFQYFFYTCLFSFSVLCQKAKIEYFYYRLKVLRLLLELRKHQMSTCGILSWQFRIQPVNNHCKFYPKTYYNEPLIQGVVCELI